MRRALLAVVACGLASCTVNKPIEERTEALYVNLRAGDGSALPGVTEPPLPLPLDEEVEILVDLIARLPNGAKDDGFNGYVRISVEPGVVVSVAGDRANGRNIVLLQGEALAQRVRLRNPRGPTRLWAEDVGYVPVSVDENPACSDGIDNDGDGLIDFPYDPGCAFANDDTETGGTHATGVSRPISFELPRLGDVQGRGARTPYPLEGVEVATTPAVGVDCDATPERCPDLIVTRISSDGFYVTDISDLGGYNHMFAFTFNSPGGLRVCDRITALSGTALEFFGFTELSFPSFSNHPWRFPTATEPGDGECLVPEPTVIAPDDVDSDAVMERLESSLVRVENVMVGAYFGPKPAGNGFAADQSNCDLDGNGIIDFSTGSPEGACANACGVDPQCVEWTGFSARGNYRVVLPNQKSLQINTGSVARTRFDPVAMRGKPIRVLSGTLRNFSGGALNWTIETRCPSDLVCDEPSQVACAEGPKDPVSSTTACVFPRSQDDPNEGSN